MQSRMKTHPLTKDQTDNLLARASVGCVATLNQDGSPYAVPVHFVYHDNAIYLHGLPKGHKLDNMKADPRVCMTIYEMDCLLMGSTEVPCDTNTVYESVVVFGRAVLLTHAEDKKRVLARIVEKYTPQLAGKVLPDNAVEGTAVIKIEIQTMTGKYYG